MNNDKLRGMSGAQMIQALAAAYATTDSDIPTFLDPKTVQREVDNQNKNRCVQCMCKIPPGKAGRKCKACR